MSRTNGIVQQVNGSALNPEAPTFSHPKSHTHGADSDSDADSDSGSSQVDGPQDFTQEDKEWQDVEQEQGDDVTFTSLLDHETFPTLQGMLDHCKEKHDLGVAETIRRLELDFLSAIKLINYIRSEAAAGNSKPALDSADRFQDDKYLQPVLEDDAVLFSLDELLEPADSTAAEDVEKPQDEQQLQIQSLQAQLNHLQRQFADYRLTVEETLEQRWSDGRSSNIGTSAQSSSGVRAPAKTIDKTPHLASVKEDNDTYYFDSYAYNDIHETMLRDTIRTNAYRDFIYEHKHLFAGKTVLDVGTGTGILAMFAAKAGAKHVFAVDNSEVVHKARQVVKDNELSEVITVLQGRVEDVQLRSPQSKEVVSEVDIIVSEWMGYGLLYESMLDSVLHARDRFLARSAGLMAPAQTNLLIAPYSSSTHMAENIHFWDSVYGFDMRAMSAHIYDDVEIRSVPSSEVVGEACTFKRLDLHSVGVRDLEFEKAPFASSVREEVAEGLTGFVVWFDTFFMTGKGEIPSDAMAPDYPGSKHADKGLSFTTGAHGKETHWKSVVLLIDHTNKKKLVNGTVDSDAAPRPLIKGDVVKGTVGYGKRKSNSRELKIEIAWEVVGADGEVASSAYREMGRQMWLLR